jgi:hypothetical protein
MTPRHGETYEPLTSFDRLHRNGLHTLSCTGRAVMNTDKQQTDVLYAELKTPKRITWQYQLVDSSEWIDTDSANLLFKLIPSGKVASYRQKPVSAYLTFVVKGPEQTAREQMFLREIVAQTINPNLFSEGTGSVVFKTGMEYHDKIAQWFGEVPEIIPGYGYPDGTCLIYSTHEEVQS